MNELPNLTSVGGEGVCEDCQYGKSHRLPFGKSQSRFKHLLELVHGDLMGPTRIASFSVFNCMLILVDDYSKYTWVYFLKNKDEVFSRFREFKATMEGEFKNKIKRFRSDNGGEFMSNEFLAFCQDHGIKREVSCPQTPQ